MAVQTEFGALIGKTIGKSQWFSLDRARIRSFEQATADEHGDLAGAAADLDGPYGNSFMRGFVALSMLAEMIDDGLAQAGSAATPLELGIDDIQFIATIPPDRRIRAVLDAVSTSQTAQDCPKVTLDVSVAVEGTNHPAIKAKCICLWQPHPAA